MKQKSWVLLFLFSDWLSAIISWILFFYFRKTYLEKVQFSIDQNFITGIICIPFAWLLLYFLQGTYIEIKRIFRLKIISLSFVAAVIGSILIFFTILLDDIINGYQNYYLEIALLFGFHFSITTFSRLAIGTLLIHSIRRPGHGFKTIIVGGNEKALEIFNEINFHPQKINSFLGYINVNGKDRLLDEKIPYLGHEKELEKVIRELNVEEVIIAIESSEHNRLKDFLVRIDDGHLRIKLLPDTYVILAGSVKMTNIYGALLVEIISEAMPFWQQAVKRMMDIVISIFAMIVLTPIYILSAIAVKLSSPGPIFFLQDRVGVNGKIFKIIKFRTMVVNAESNGPQLSSAEDPRITKIGRFMRKTRLDEFPQFLNVLLGQMSLVGPRPERQFYMDQIVKIEPQYLHLNRVRPGITSWGQVKFGYAENVEQMLQRMKFDLIYMKNRSLALDVKIMFYTLIIIFKAKGK
jgi:exopolysaccharide biosynthesis polyprenyl glycosylphosphotransferase